MKFDAVIGILAFVSLLVLRPSGAEAFGLKEGLKNLGSLALLSGAARAGVLEEALVKSSHKHEEPVYQHHMKHIHLHS